MSTPFVQFPGTAGNYVFTADVNLLDADTAHLQASLGLWTASASYTASQSQSVTPIFGDYVGKAITTAEVANPYFYTTPTDAIAVDASTQYTLSIDLQWPVDLGLSGFIRIRERDSVGASVGITDQAFTISSINTWERKSITWTTSATTVGLAVQVYLSGTVPDASVLYWDASCLRAGSDGTFVPSLRIVGDLDLRAKAAADDWTSSNRALMSNYNGDGFLLYHDASGYLHFESGGATGAIDESSALYTFVDGQTAEVRVTLDVSAGNIVWYESGVQVDTDTFTAQALDPGSNQLSVAADYLGTGLLFAGDIYYCEVRDGIAGPVVARFDAADVLAAL